MTKNTSSMSNWIIITYRTKKYLAQLKKHLPAALDKTLTLHKSATLLALGEADSGHTAYGGDF